jgi:hypothetical protein
VLNPAHPLAPFCPLFTNLENQLLFSWCEYPSTLVPILLTTAPPSASSLTLSHPTDQVTIDDINNTSRPRRAQFWLFLIVTYAVALPQARRKAAETAGCGIIIASCRWFSNDQAGEAGPVEQQLSGGQGSQM